MVAVEPSPLSFKIMKKSAIVATGLTPVRIPLLPILWVRHLSDGSAVATLALIRLLSDNLKLNWAMRRHRITKHDFRFIPSGHGHYKVTYTSPVTGRQWTAVTSDMPLIDDTKNCDEPKVRDLNYLKKVCKSWKRWALSLSVWWLPCGCSSLSA